MLLPLNVIATRALKQTLEDNNLTIAEYNNWTTDVQLKFQDLVMSIADDMRYNQLKYFRPFQHQMKFFATGNSPRRGLIAGNRTGKTVATCFELAMHLTGLYPEWWVGKRFTQGISAVVAGESWQQVANVLQNELLGTRDVKITQDIGTGSIPKDNIKMDTIRADGPNVIMLQIKHVAGDSSELRFVNYTQETRQMQGFKLDLVVLDEQPPDDFFSELVTRTATTQGQVLCSFTPLKGMTKLVENFLEAKPGYEYVQVGWNNVPEYNLWGEPFLLESTRKQMMADWMPYEREARLNGRPLMGKGAVFQIANWPTYKTGEYDFATIPNVHRVISLDLGLVNDQTVISLIYWHPQSKTLWLNTQIVLNGVEEADPTLYIQHLMRPEVYGTPIVLPADAGTQGRYTMSSLSLREMFESYELNVLPGAIMNPPDIQGRTTNHKSYGINIMRQMLTQETFLINENCVEFLRQAKNYSVDLHGRFSDPDDAIDSARYGLLACLQNLAEPWDNLNPRQRMAQYRNQVKKTTDYNKTSELKQVFST